MKVGFIGGGKMGEAIVESLLRTGTVEARSIHVCEIDEERRRLLEDEHGISVSADAKDMLAQVKVVFLAVKPQNLDALLVEVAQEISEKQLVISIAAGKRLDQIESLLPDARVVRVMPNLAATVSESMNVFCAGARVTDDDRETVVTLLSSFGRALELPEEHFDAVTALSGSGPAFFAHFLQLMVEGGVGLGLERKEAELLAEQTMLGTAMLLAKGDLSAEELIASVSSKGGTTAAGMAVLTDSTLRETIAETLDAAAQRGAELSGRPT